MAKEQNKKPGDLYPELDFSKNDPQRKSQAEKNAQDLFSSFPTNPISIASDFYKSLADKFGDRFSEKAKSLPIESKSKKIRSATEAIAAFDKYKNILNKKFSITDRVAIAKALESIDKQMMAAQLKKFGKMFGIIGESLLWGQFLAGIVKGLRTGEWEDAIIGGEKIAVGKIAAFIAVVAFSSIAVSPVGIIGFSFIMATTSALISDDMLKDMNNLILSI
ncbi:colicin-like pore-forming protein [Klebsiella sp. BIGb0407]|uniref:colicin-like pore-forming protein n=1 Tax=Klebsiella sp. BIGb0407 TaxID=2940603 RepID=UPI00286E6EBB|nr:colicin-like pore-forming protein [Klebsiella sp. BIGb0407]